MKHVWLIMIVTINNHGLAMSVYTYNSCGFEELDASIVIFQLFDALAVSIPFLCSSRWLENTVETVISSHDML